MSHPAPHTAPPRPPCPQDAIVSLLERINKLQSIASGALPSTKKFKEMQDELEYKKMQLENTQARGEGRGEGGIEGCVGKGVCVRR